MHADDTLSIPQDRFENRCAEYAVLTRSIEAIRQKKCNELTDVGPEIRMVLVIARSLFKAFFRNKVRKKRNGNGMFITSYRAGCIGIKALSKSAPKGVKPRLIGQCRELGKQLVARLTKIRTGHAFFLKERSQYFR